MNTDMDKPRLLDLIRAERGFLQRTLDMLTEDQMTAPKLDGGWSVKDLLAHIVHWEQWAIGLIESGRRGVTPEPPGFDISETELHRLNDQIFQQNKARPLADVLADFRRSHDQITRLVEAMTDDELFSPGHFSSFSILGWQLIVYNSSDHYLEHAKQIRTWLSSQE